jgi:hypothetical protein
MKKVFIVFVALAMAACLTPLAEAQIMEGYHMGQLILPDAEIIVDDKVFSDWNIFTNMGIETPPSSIWVIPLADDPLTADPDPGLLFLVENDALTVNNSDGFKSFGFSYEVSTVDGSFLIEENTLELKDYTIEPINGDTNGTDAAVFMTELLFDLSDNDLGGKAVCAGASCGAIGLSDSAQFDPQSALIVNTLVTVQGEDGYTVGINTFEQRFSQVPVPEPATMLLLGFGLVGLGAARRRLK